MSSEPIADAPPRGFALGARRYWPAHGVLVLAALLPLTLVDIPALVDYPNHLARIHVLAEIGRDDILSANYKVVWGATPNLAMDVLLPPLTQLFSLTVLGRMFVAVAMLSLIAGTLLLHRTLHGTVGLWTVAVYLFVYNHLLIMGFLNYLFSVGLALLLFAAWIASATRPPWIRWVLFPPALAVLFFAHIFALGTYAVCVGAYELSRAWPVLRTEWRSLPPRLAVVAWQFLPAACLVLATMPDTGSGDFIYGPFLSKVRAIWSPTLTYIRPTDAAVFLFVAAVCVGGLATRRLTLAPAVRLPLVVLTAIATAMPFWVEGAWGVTAFMDLRLPLVIALLLVAGIRPCHVAPRIAVAVVCAGAVVLGARIVDISLVWRGLDRQYAEFRAAARLIEPGAAILPVQKRDARLPAGQMQFGDVYWHMPLLAVIDRGAFVPTLFTDPAKQPVRAADGRAFLDTAFGAPIEYALLVDSAYGIGAVQGGQGMSPFWTDWPRHYDYVLATHFGDRANPLPELLIPLHQGSFFTLYRVVPPP